MEGGTPVNEESKSVLKEGFKISFLLQIFRHWLNRGRWGLVKLNLYMKDKKSRIRPAPVNKIRLLLFLL